MVDLIVPAGTVLQISQPSQVEPRYALFRMESNSKIVASIDLTIRASRAEFGDNCIIDARGAPGMNGNNGANGQLGGNGGSGTDGLPGQSGRSLTIEAELAKVGGLTIISDGGAGGRGGAGGAGDAHLPGVVPGAGGRGGSGASGGDAGQISLTWTRLAPHPPVGPGGIAPRPHLPQQRRSWRGWRHRRDWRHHVCHGGRSSRRERQRRSNGKSFPVQVTWRANMTALLWVQKQDIGPAPRAHHDIAFDPLRGRLVLFGGVGDGKVTGDTWEWDGRFWVQVADTGPAPRAYHGMALGAFLRGPPGCRKAVRRHVVRQHKETASGQVRSVRFQCHPGVRHRGPQGLRPCGPAQDTGDLLLRSESRRDPRRRGALARR